MMPLEVRSPDTAPVLIRGSVIVRKRVPDGVAHSLHSCFEKEAISMSGHPSLDIHQ